MTPCYVRRRRRAPIRVTIHEYLSADHARLDALLAQATTHADPIDAAAYDQFRRGLLRHIAMEEKVLFVLARQQEGTVELVKRLHADHAAIASLLVPPPTVALISTLRCVLEEHNPLEDAVGGLYDQCDRAAGAGAADVLARMGAIPAARASQHLDEPRIHEHIARMLAARERFRRSS